MTKVQLNDNYFVKEVSVDEWHSFFEEHVNQVFPDEQSIPLNFLLSQPEQTKLDRLQTNLSQRKELYFLLLDEDKPIGWHFGFQRSELEYFMANTGILPEYRNRKVYSSFLTYAIQRLTDEGFQYITSIHHATNNAVLIPKLKAGFLIQSFGFLIQTMILESNYGPMIQLVYPTKAAYRKLFEPQFGINALNEALKAE
jgi:hypothetical protein